MNEEVGKQEFGRASGEMFAKGLERVKRSFEGYVDFLKKGAERRQTQIRIKEFKLERLKRIPNYVVLEAARKHVRLAMEGVLAFSFLLNVILGWQLVSLSERLAQKRIALVPSRLDQTTEVDVGRISEAQVHSTFVMYLTMLGTVDSTNIDENHRILKDFMSAELKVQFERETRDYRQMVKTEGLSEQAVVSTKNVTIAKDGQIEAQAVLRVRPAIGATLGKVRDERVVMRMKVIANYERNQWLLQITSLSRGPVQNFGRDGKGA